MFFPSPFLLSFLQVIPSPAVPSGHSPQRKVRSSPPPAAPPDTTSHSTPGWHGLGSQGLSGLEVPVGVSSSSSSSLPQEWVPLSYSGTQGSPGGQGFGEQGSVEEQKRPLPIMPAASKKEILSF